jgi:aspartate ammonia-lyase
MVDATANADVFVEVSGILKAHASNLLKIANDLRLMNLLGEIKLPQLQTGSSVMPGKSNPVILEAVMQAGMKIMANDFLVTEAASRATFQICEFMPLLACALLESIELLTRSDEMFATHVAGIKADPERCQIYVDQAEGIITAFVPQLGYDKAAEILREFRKSENRNLRVFLEERLGKEIVAKTLSPQNLLSLGHKDYAKNT